MDKTKRDLIEFINALEIPGLIVEDLHLFKGDFVNLEYVLDNGSKFKLLKDEDDYYGVQVETDTCVCYGLVTASKILSKPIYFYAFSYVLHLFKYR